MKALVTFFLLFFMGNSTSHAQLISTDDQLHFGAGAFISGATYAVVYSATKNKRKAFWYGLGASVLAGLGKEVYDGTQENNKFDTGELVATSLGGFTTGFIINLFAGKRKNKRVSFVPVE